MYYNAFLQSIKFEHTTNPLSYNYKNSMMFDFQNYVTDWILKKGKGAVFGNTGTGKSVILLTCANNILKETNKPVLLLSPLAVSLQTIQEAKKFNLPEVIRIRHDTKIENKIYITNYEQLDNIDLNKFKNNAVIPDESSILRNADGKTSQKLRGFFKDFQYKLCFTATPSPNDWPELGGHCEFLNVMSWSAMKSMFFTHDGSDTSKWYLKKHSENDFWKFVASWAIMYSHPSDLGFKQDGYDLPKLNINEVVLKTQTQDGMLFNIGKVNSTDYNQSLKQTKEIRLNKAVEIIRYRKDQSFVVFVNHNGDDRYIINELKDLNIDIRKVEGSDKDEYKEQTFLDFINGKFQVLITKTKMASFGLNFQKYCYNMIFTGVDFKYESTYQGIKRIHRFGQEYECNVWLITTDRMDNVLKIHNKKDRAFKHMQSKMSDISRQYFGGKKEMEIKYLPDVKTNNYHLMNGNCMSRLKDIQDKSIHFSIFSPPFAEIYTYSDNIEDLGNAKNYKEFKEHFSYLIPELSRVIMDGRLIAVHCMDLPIMKGREGFNGLRDFSGLILNEFQKNNFIYHSRITLWKNPATEMQRTKSIGLLHKQLKKDASRSRVGIPDYLMIFKKHGDNLIPINQDGKIPVDLWQEWASPVWYVNQTNVLKNYSKAKDLKDVKHICPLQLETIERAILLWTNENETVLSPFGGIGSEGYQALKNNRKSVSIELKESYFKINKLNHENALSEKAQLSLL